MPPTFDGAKLSVTKMLSSHFQVSHSMTLTSGSNSGYRFGANYVGTQLYSHAEVKQTLLCRIFLKKNLFHRCFQLFWVIWIRMEMPMLK
jgi:mitochondrial import receptor subunit TOM40